MSVELQQQVDPATVPAYQPRLAGKGRRFATFAIDYVLYLALAIVAAMVAPLIWGEGIMVWFDGLRSYLTASLLLMAFYLVFEGTCAFTPGKLFVGTRVVDEQGRPPTLRQVFVRTIARFIPFEPFSVLLNDDARGWHDSLAKTYVVLAPEAPVNR